MEYSASGMCLTAADGRFIHVNSALCEMLGYSADELTRTTWPELTHPDDLDADLREAQSLFSGVQDHYRMVKRFITSSGEVVWGDMSVGAVRDVDGSVLHLVAQIADVTGRVLAEQALAERERLLQIVLDNAPETAMRLDAGLRVQYVNKRAIDVSGIPFDQWIGKTLQELGYPPELTRRWDGYHRHVFETGESVRYEFEIDNVDGHRWYESRSVAEFGPDGTVSHLVATSRDITDHKIAEQQLMRLATHDPLTGLANRAALSEEITRALAVGRRAQTVTGLLMIDLDRFKNVNDSLGHGVGDALLQAAADRLTHTVRDGDLVARPGGDEFMVVMRDLDLPSDAVHAAWRIVEAFREPFAFLGAEMFATASVGVAIASLDSKADDLIREADTALYVAKDEGRDRVSVFNEDLRAEVTARLTIEGELRHALGRGQLEVWYQPEVELATGQVIAVEALLRWRHPDGGVRPAGGFIEVAEETGLILDIGEWVLQQAFTDAARWAAEVSPERALTVRVNVSALQLAEPSLLESIDNALALTGADPSQLCIEITETALLRETAATRDNLTGIRSRGIQIAADDFGTGFASLAYLLQYPVDVLKIDRSFVDGITTSDQSRRLVAGIISLADALGMTVTAEGVERADQASMLCALRCPGAQGYLYSPAVPADQIPAMLLKPFEPAESSPGT
jgi:diguanylate cyclase (GGDEF)-like protein/PAS domain S-box-containing protein